MKKTLILLVAVCCVFLLTGCGSSSVSNNASVEDLLDDYIEAFMKADNKKLLNIFPSFMESDVNKYFSEEALKNQVASLKEQYGDDFKITYKINETIKATDEQLSTFNNSLKNHYSNAIEASECYAYDGEFVYKGSKSSETGSLSDIVYCKFDNAWKLVIS